MTRMPSVSWNGGLLFRASCAPVYTYPLSVGVADSGLLRFQSTCPSFHDGLGFSMHCVFNLYDATAELLLSSTQSFGGGSAGSHPGFVGAAPWSGAAPEVGLNCGSPSNEISENLLLRQYCRSAPK